MTRLPVSLLTALAAMLALAACSEAPAGEPVVRTVLDGSVEDAPEGAPDPLPANRGPSDCREVVFEDTALTHCTADPAKHRIGMANLGADKQPFASLSAFAASLDPEAIAFAMNGGMYGDDLKAIGYYVKTASGWAI